MVEGVGIPGGRADQDDDSEDAEIEEQVEEIAYGLGEPTSLFIFTYGLGEPASLFTIHSVMMYLGMNYSSPVPAMFIGLADRPVTFNQVLVTNRLSSTLQATNNVHQVLNGENAQFAEAADKLLSIKGVYNYCCLYVVGVLSCSCGGKLVYSFLSCQEGKLSLFCSCCSGIYCWTNLWQRLVLKVLYQLISCLNYFYIFCKIMYGILHPEPPLPAAREQRQQVLEEALALGPGGIQLDLNGEQYDRYIFKETVNKQELIWSRIIDTKKEFVVTMGKEEMVAGRKQLVTVGGSEGYFPSFSHLQSHYLVDSSLSQDIAKYDYTTSLGTVDKEADTKEVRKGGSMTQFLPVSSLSHLETFPVEFPDPDLRETRTEEHTNDDDDLMPAFNSASLNLDEEYAVADAELLEEMKEEEKQKELAELYHRSKQRKTVLGDKNGAEKKRKKSEESEA